jgi:hypothetical protein
MKQVYQKPEQIIINVEAEQLIAASLGTSEDKADPDAGVLSNERRDKRTWGDLWGIKGERLRVSGEWLKVNGLTVSG